MSEPEDFREVDPPEDFDFEITEEEYFESVEARGGELVEKFRETLKAQLGEDAEEVVGPVFHEEDERRAEEVEVRGQVRAMMKEIAATLRRMRRTQRDIDRLKEETWAVLARIDAA